MTATRPTLASGVTVAFDWNGTLSDDVGHAATATNTALSPHDAAPLSEPGFRAAFILPLETFFGSLGVPEGEVGAAVACWNAAMAAAPVCLMDGALDALRALRRDGARVGVISAASASAIERGVHRLALESGGELDFVVAAVPDKADAIASVVRAAPGPVLYVGDTEYDVTSAQRGGARAVGFAGGYRPRAALEAAAPEWLLSDLAEVVAIARAVAPDGAWKGAA